jgi:hypothetical protein
MSARHNRPVIHARYMVPLDLHVRSGAPIAIRNQAQLTTWTLLTLST